MLNLFYQLTRIYWVCSETTLLGEISFYYYYSYPTGKNLSLFHSIFKFEKKQKFYESKSGTEIFYNVLLFKNSFYLKFNEFLEILFLKLFSIVYSIHSMNILEIENFFGNSSFFFLLSSMILYWVYLIFNFKFLNFGKLCMICANFSLLSLLVLRWKESGHFPLSNLYESLMFLSWSFSIFHLILENVEFHQKKSFLNTFYSWSSKVSQLASSASQPAKQAQQEASLSSLTSEAGSAVSTSWASWQAGKIKEAEQSSSSQTHVPDKQYKPSFFAALTSPPALFTNAFATFSLPSEMQHSSALVPALQSNWLMMHVTVMILSYSALICGSLLSIAFLIFSRNLDISFLSKKEISTSIGKTIYLETQSPTMISTKQKFAEKLDNLSYRILGIGFPLLTIGILSGAVWANEAWGSYWSWDPKETWALATWFVFAIYLHTRFTKGWSGKKPAIIATLGFVTVWICFLGVNLLGEGLHSYGFFK